MGEVQEFANWMAKCPLPKEKIKVIPERIKVKSSNLDFVSFDGGLHELSVWFKSRKAEEHYVYSNVSVITFGELMKAESKGKYFIANIKGNEFIKQE